MNKLNLTPCKVNEYIKICKEQIKLTEKTNDKYSLENIKNLKEMLNILEERERE